MMTADAMRIEPIVDPDLVPFQPPERFPTGLSGFRTFLRNFIEIFPRSVYERGLTRIKQGFIDTLVICDPKLIQDVLVDRADVFRLDPVSRRTLATFTGESSIFLAEGAEWRWQRRAVAPTFRHEALLSFVPVFAEMAARQIARWRSAPPNTPIDVFAAVHETTFDVIVETMLGGASAFDSDDYRRALTAIQDAAVWQSLFALFMLPRWTPFPGRKREARARAHLHQQMKRIVASRRARPSAKPDLLDLLLAAKDAETGRGLSDDELATNLIAFVNAGHESTAAALTWTLWLVARDPALQQTLVDEVAAVAGENPIAATHLDGLALCRQAIQESMRLYPPGTALARQATSNTRLGDQDVTTSTMILIPIFALHRHRLLWDHPDRFDLNRFAPAAVKARPRHAYLPFSAGQRVCIGASFAMMEATVMLASVLRAFRLRPLPGFKPRPIARLSLLPEGGMPLLVEPR
jgi:cytochrome P450